MNCFLRNYCCSFMQQGLLLRFHLRDVLASGIHGVDVPEVRPSIDKTAE